MAILVKILLLSTETMFWEGEQADMAFDWLGQHLFSSTARSAKELL